MYNIKGPSKIVAKSTRRGISQNIDNIREKNRNQKPLDSNDNEIVNGPKPVFNNIVKRAVTCHHQENESISPQHEEIIKYIQDSWLSVRSDVDGKCSESKTNNNCNSNCSVMYFEDDPCPRLQDFKPFDLESWWGKRLYNLITNTAGIKD